MVEVGIPVYKAKDTLPAALDSLVAQTHQFFITCLSIDGDEENYSNIINEYRRRGLKIRVINSAENGGPGIARQRIIDSTMCDFLMFLDADDLLMPRAIEILYKYIRLHNYDILRSSFIREESNKEDSLMTQDHPSITWLHGKIYKVKFLKEKNIRFLPNLRTDEDAYFNLVAWNCTNQRGELAEATYIWRYNNNSITRHIKNDRYFKETYVCYIMGQVEGLKKIFNINHEINNELISLTLLNIYYYYMQAHYFKLPLEEINQIISTFKQEQWLQFFLSDNDNWKIMARHIHGAKIIEDNIIFFDEPFNLWIERLLRA